MNYLTTGEFFGETEKTIFVDGITLTETQYLVEYVDWHYHENPYFTFILAGGIVEGNRHLTNKCGPGTLLFHNWQEPHYNEGPESGTRGFQLEAESSWFEKFDIDLECLPSNLNVIDPLTRIHFHNIYKETRLSDSESHLSIEGLLVEALTGIGDFERFVEKRKPNWVARADEILHDGLAEHLTLQRLAGELDLHPIYLCRAFRKFFHCSYGQYVRRLKIERSLNMLRNPNLSLTEISTECKFADQSHFIRCFREFIGMKPKDYRNLVLKS